jgi:peptidoglycan/xylan/chitin deacetylase (PgdA/CDA1 family)
MDRGLHAVNPMKWHVLLCVCTLALTAACDGRPVPDGARRDDAGGAGTIEPGTMPGLPAMAVTIDDLPWIGAVRPGETRLHALARLADALVARDVPAMAFVNCERLGAGATSVRQWLDAGLQVGNHSAAHLDLNSAPLRQWLDDVQSCHVMVQQLTGDDTAWFRYPFLHQGATAERQQAALDLLEQLGSPIAHVTIDTSDWILAVAYGEAVAAGRGARADSIADAFVEHVLRATSHYQDVAHRKVGRDVPHVLLLHANLLVADHIGGLLDALTARGFRFVSVAEAHRDPIYSVPDDYTGRDGLSWLYRMAPTTPGGTAWDDAEAAALRRQWR